MIPAKYITVFALCGLTGCYNASHTVIDSSPQTGTPVPALHKVYLQVDAGGPGTITFPELSLLSQKFNDTFLSEMRTCHVDALSSYDERVQLMGPGGGMIMPDMPSKLRKIDQDKASTFAPDAILKIGAANFTSRVGHFDGDANPIIRIKYDTWLDSYPADNRLWFAAVNLYPVTTETDKGLSAGDATLARDIVKKLAADGLLTNCPLTKADPK